MGRLEFPALVYAGDAGDGGETVLFLHGFPQSPETWHSLLLTVGGTGRRAVAPLQRGYAPRARPADRRAYAPDHLKADVMGMADALEAARFHVVGHDWGGVVAWGLAADHPARVISVTSLSTPHLAAMARSMVGIQGLRSAYTAFVQLPAVPEVLLGAGNNRLLRLALERSGLSPEWARRHTDGLDRDTLHAALQWYRAAGPAQLAAMAPITVPTLYLWGSRDVALGRRAAVLTQDYVKAPYDFRILDASHWLPEHHAPEIAEALLPHLDRAERPTGPTRPTRSTRPTRPTRPA